MEIDTKHEAIRMGVMQKPLQDNRQSRKRYLKIMEVQGTNQTRWKSQ